MHSTTLNSLHNLYKPALRPAGMIYKINQSKPEHSKLTTKSPKKPIRISKFKNLWKLWTTGDELETPIIIAR